MEAVNVPKKPKLTLIEIIEVLNAGGEITDRELADYLRLSEDWGWLTVQKWVKEGKLRGGRVGKYYRFRKQDIDDFTFSKK